MTRTQEHPHRADRVRASACSCSASRSSSPRSTSHEPARPEIPPTGEEIHLPGPSILPLLTAVGITLALVGITTFIELTVVGVILTIVCVVPLDQDTRHEIDELPLDAHDDLLQRRVRQRAHARVSSSGACARSTTPRAARSKPHACPLAAHGATRSAPPLRSRAPDRSPHPRSSSARRRAPRGSRRSRPCSSDDQMTEAAADHRRGGLLQRPVGRGVDDVARQMLGDELCVRVLPGAERVQDVALGDDARAVPVGVDDDGGADRRSDISRATARSVCPGPTVRTVGLIPSLYLHHRLLRRCSAADLAAAAIATIASI